MVALRALVPVRTLRPVDEQRELFRDPLALLLEHRAAPSVVRRPRGPRRRPVC